MCSPDGMIRSVQNCPSASMLTDLKDCLDFCSNSWVSLFCRQGGTALLLQVCTGNYMADARFGVLLRPHERTADQKEEQ